MKFPKISFNFLKSARFWGITFILIGISIALIIIAVLADTFAAMIMGGIMFCTYLIIQGCRFLGIELN
jgi:hypothetical protein